MSASKTKIFFRIIGIIIFLFSIILGLITYNQSQTSHCVFPQGSKIDALDISNLSKEQAKQYLVSVYGKPLKLSIEGLEIDILIERTGYEFLYDDMVNRLDCDSGKAFDRFWQYIWNKETSNPIQVDLLYNFNETILGQTIDEEVVRLVEKTPVLPVRIPGTTRFTPGASGSTLDKERLIEQIKREVVKNERKTLLVEPIEIVSSTPSSEMIKEQVKEIIADSQFSGVVEMYARNLHNQEIVQLLTSDGVEYDPGVAFTAASTMKIPILLSTYWRYDNPLTEMMNSWIEEMIVFSENDPADRLMEQIDAVRGPLLVTNDMASLGFENTYIAGYFYLGAPLLNLYQTPANQRQDINVDPDVYNQTTPQEIGELLTMIYECAEEENSDLVSTSNGSITPEECGLIIDVLAKNKMGALIEAGLPENTTIAHKHGWSQEQDGLVHSFSDVGIVFGPENDFVLTIFLYSEDQLLFDVANPLVARISQAIYNAYNLNHQIAWPFPENE